MYGIKINGVSYDVAYEYPVTYTLDKSLDFGSMVIPVLQNKDPFPMYSLVEITRDNDEIEYFLVSGDVVKLSSYNPPLYSHTIQLVEYTKKLENYLISAAAFTQPTDGTTRYTYYDVLDRLVKISIFETEYYEIAKRPCVLDSSLLELDTIKAPEFFFNNITLRAALDEVLSSLPAIARLKRINGVDTLFVDYLDATHAVVTITDDVTYNGEQNINNYSTSLVSDITNSIRGTQGNESISIYPNSNGWSPLSTKEGVGVLDNINAVMDAKDEIYDIVKLEIKAPVRLRYLPEGAINIVTELLEITADITQYVFTKEQYDALPTTWFSGSWSQGLPTEEFPLPTNLTTQEMIDLGYITKQNAIWFERNTPFIDGLTTNWQEGAFTFEGNKRRSLENLLLGFINIDEYEGLQAVIIGDPDNTGANQFDPQPIGWETVFFRITYIPRERTRRVEVERDDLTRFLFESKSYFKQNASLINLNQYINKMDADLQRIGEETFVVNVILQSYNNLFSLGDVTEDGFVLVSFTTTQHLDHIEVSYNFTRNYQQINEMIAIDKSKDQFELVSDEKVLNRQLLYKDYVILSDYGSTIPSEQSIVDPTAQEIYVNTFIRDPLLNRQMAQSAVWIKPGISPTNLLALLNASGSGASLLFSSGFRHNSLAGAQTEFDEDFEGYVLSPVEYAPNGELEDFNFKLIARFQSADGTIEQIQENARKLPLLTRTDFTNLIGNVVVSNIFNVGRFKVYKDPGERLSLSYQIQAIVGPDNLNQIILGNYFSNYNLLVHPDFENLYIHFSNETYAKGDIEKVKINPTNPSGELLIADYIVGPTGISIQNIIPTTANSYGVSDSQGRLLFAVNRKDGTILKNIKFTFSHTRPGLQKL